MIQRIDLRGRTLSAAELLALVPRARTDVSVATATAEELIADVRRRGEAALRDQAERLDRVRPPRVRVGAEEISAAGLGLDPQVRTALEEAISRVRQASTAQLPTATV